MNCKILGLLAETAIHPGVGSDNGFADLPVAREAATDYPVIVGSSFKGALLDMARTCESILDEAKRNDIFGQQDNAGALIVSDVRLLLLPVRSMSSHYKWVTCPHLIERFQRDLGRGGDKGQSIGFDGLLAGKYLGAGPDALFLEERQFSHGGLLTNDLVELIGKLIPHDSTRKRLPQQLVVLHDDDFSWFSRYGLAINARNVRDEVKKTSKNLWYEETIPPDGLFYCLLAERGNNAVSETIKLFKERPYIQVGGNASVGQGWFSVNLPKEGALI
jgi:CRISPR-associated protein Cmr4